MAKKRRGLKGQLASIVHDVAVLIAGVRRLKDRLKGQKWRRAHRIESELTTLAGVKAPVKKTGILASVAQRKEIANLTKQLRAAKVAKTKE